LSEPKAIDLQITQYIEEAFAGKYLPLTDWETEFFKGLSETLQFGKPLTPRQRMFAIKTTNRIRGTENR
jgi:hypothetical protein